MRKTFIVLPALLIAVSGGIFQAAQARSQEVETTYYSDASKKEEVGGSLLSCGGGGIVRWGRQTQYKTTSSSPCD